MFVAEDAGMRAYFALAALLIIGTTRASADECAPVDFSARMGVARDQGDTDWCGSMVAADLLSYRLGVRVSATSIGSNYYAGRSATEARFLDKILGIPAGEYGGALISSILTQNLRGSVCFERDVPDERLTEAKWDVFARIRSLREGANVQPLCAEPYDLSWLGWTIVGRDYVPRPNLAVVHRQMLAKNPVAAMVDMNQLFGLRQTPSDIGTRTFGDHFVVVAGQKRIAGVCHLLVRNSWGESCDRYFAEGIVQCDRGQMWVREDHFASALKNVLYLTN